MSGLLSKATAAEDATKSEPVEEEAKSDAGLLDASIQQSDGPDLSTILTSVGWAVIVVGGLLSLQGGFWGLVVVVSVLIIGIGALYGGQFLSEDGVNPTKMGIAAGLAILLTVGPYGVGLFIGAPDTFAVTELEYDEQIDEISFMVEVESMRLQPRSVTSRRQMLSLRCGLIRNRSVITARFKIPISRLFHWKQ